MKLLMYLFLLNQIRTQMKICKKEAPKLIYQRQTFNVPNIQTLIKTCSKKSNKNWYNFNLNLDFCKGYYKGAINLDIGNNNLGLDRLRLTDIYSCARLQVKLVSEHYSNMMTAQSSLTTITTKTPPLSRSAATATTSSLTRTYSPGSYPSPRQAKKN